MGQIRGRIKARYVPGLSAIGHHFHRQPQRAKYTGDNCLVVEQLYYVERPLAQDLAQAANRLQGEFAGWQVVVDRDAELCHPLRVVTVATGHHLHGMATLLEADDHLGFRPDVVQGARVVPDKKYL